MATPCSRRARALKSCAMLALHVSLPPTPLAHMSPRHCWRQMSAAAPTHEHSLSLQTVCVCACMFALYSRVPKCQRYASAQARRTGNCILCSCACQCVIL